jgi:hypothetical protein
MIANPSSPHPSEDPEARLERAFIDDFLRLRGHTTLSLAVLPDGERQQLLRDASTYAAGKLTEVEARAHFVHELHGDTKPAG